MCASGFRLSCVLPRMGNCDRFGNKEVKKLHDVGTRIVMETDFSLHENVEEFQEDFLFLAVSVETTFSKCNMLFLSATG